MTIIHRTAAHHYLKAEEYLQMIEDQNKDLVEFERTGTFTPESAANIISRMTGLIALAQVHATLATAPEGLTVADRTHDQLSKKGTYTAMALLSDSFTGPDDV